MGKYDVTHSCGHTEEVELFGKMEGRYSRLEWLAKQPCKGCWLKAKREAEAEEPMAVMVGGTIISNGEGNPPCALVKLHITKNAYSRKEELKTRGYKWDGEAWWHSYRTAREAAVEINYLNANLGGVIVTTHNKEVMDRIVEMEKVK